MAARKQIYPDAREYPFGGDHEDDYGEFDKRDTSTGRGSIWGIFHSLMEIMVQRDANRRERG